MKKGEKPESRFASAEKGGRLYIHQVKRGETLSRIARLYNVTPEVIMQWNNLESIHRIKAGQNLALYLDQGGMPASIAMVGKNTAQTGGLRAKADLGPAPSGKKKVTYYRVRQGDSLWTIAKKFRVSPQQIRKWNRLSSNLIHPGKKLVVRKG